MPPWIVKAAVQGVVAGLPNAHAVNHLFQKYLTRSVELTDTYFMKKWRQCERHIRNHRRVNATPNVALELGTGWFPIIPVGLALAGIGRVYSIDTNTLLTASRVRDTFLQYAQCIAHGTVTAISRDRVERMKDLLKSRADASPNQLLQGLGVHVLTADARHIRMDAGEVDLILSNNTLEHIPKETIAQIFREFHRVSHARSMMSHHIDLADHYKRFDGSITAYNFLKYSDRTWRWFNNSLQYQNRLRISDFRELHARTGWKVLHEDSQREPPEVLRSLNLAERFREYSEEDLLVYDTWLVSTLA